MTSTERVRRHRARFRYSEPAQDIAENAMQAPVAPLNARIRALELELARERKRREAAEASHRLIELHHVITSSS